MSHSTTSAKAALDKVDAYRERLFEKTEGVRPGDPNFEALKKKVDRSGRLKRSIERRLDAMR